MSKMRIIALSGAVGCALVAAFLAKGLIGRKPEVQQQVINKVETVNILVAQKDLQMGDKLAGAIGWKAWPKENLNPSMIQQDAAHDIMPDLANARTRLPMFQDEPVLDKKILKPGVGGFMAAMLPKGMRAVSVTIAPKTSAGGFILPNDRVDVILTTKSNGPNGGPPIVTSRTVVQNVRVLAVNQIYKPAGDNDPVAVEKGETATLELTPKQSEVLYQVESSGELSLALRSITESEGLTADQNQPHLSGHYSGGKEDGGDPLFVRAGTSTHARSQ